MIHATATIPGFNEFKHAFDWKLPDELRQATKRAFKRMGGYDVHKFTREQLKSSFNIKDRTGKFVHSFVWRVHGDSINDLTLDEHTGWPAMQVFETGGAIGPKNAQALLVLMPDAYKRGGGRWLTGKTLPGLLQSGELQIVKTKLGEFVVSKYGGQEHFVATFSRHVIEPKMISWFDNFEQSANRHQEILDEEAGKAVGVRLGVLPMSNPILEQVAANLLVTLQTVTTANGYSYTLNAVRRAKTNDPGHLTVVIHQDDGEELPEQTIDKWWQREPFIAQVFIMPPDGDPTPLDTYVNCIGADIRKAVMIDFTRGGLALDTRTLPTVKRTSTNGQVTIAWVPIPVDFRTAYNDPYSL